MARRVLGRGYKEPGGGYRIPIYDDVSYGSGGIAGGKFLFVNDTENPSYIVHSGTLQGTAPPIVANLAGWFKFNTGITEAGSGVSQWNDLSSNSRHLLQTTDANRPAKQSDGSILFDGGNDLLETGAFTFNQPATFYLLCRQITWASNQALTDGVDGTHRQVIEQKFGGASPQLDLYAGSFAITNAELVLNVYGVVSAVFNDAASVLQVDNGTPVIGNPGTQNPGGFVLGNAYDGSVGSNIQVKEAILVSAAHSPSTRAAVIDYLNNGQGAVRLASTASSTDDAYNGMNIQITGGTGSGQDHLSITDYDGTNKIAVLSGSWVTVPDSTSTYRIVNRAY